MLRLNKIIAVLLTLLLIPTQIFAASEEVLTPELEKWTKASIPDVTFGKIDKDLVEVLVSSQNPPGTLIRLYGSDDGQQWTLLAEEIDLDRFVETGLIEGKPRYYKANAVNGEGIESNDSPVSFAIPTDPNKPTEKELEDIAVIPSPADPNKVKIIGLENPNPLWKYTTTIKDKDENILDVSPTFDTVADLEDWISERLQPNTKYILVIGVQLGDIVESRKEKTVIYITLPAPIDLNKIKVNSTTNTITVDLTEAIGSNPKGTEYKLTIQPGGQTLTTSTIGEFKDLKPSTQYEIIVQIMRPDDSYLDMGRITKRTDSPPPPPSTPGASGGNSPENEFKQKAGEVLSSVTIITDGVRNSGKAWIDVMAKNTPFTVKATLDKSTKTLSGKSIRFDGVNDNSTYTVTIEITNGKYSTKQDFTVRTPNRTPPKVKKVYVDNGKIYMWVESISDLKK
jgi:hypothetical protein